MSNYLFKQIIFIFITVFCINLNSDIHAKSGIIKDKIGRSISVKKPFKRIISLYGAHTENLFALGLDQEIIGVNCGEVYPKHAAQKPRFSYHDNSEKFLAARPDLVLIRPMIERGYSRLIARLEKSNITVFSLQPSSINDMYNYWMILGILTGKQEQASSMITAFKSTKENFLSLIQDIDKKKKVYFEAIHNKMKTFTNDSMAIFVLKTAGGINIAEDADQVRTTNIAFYGKERIIFKAEEIDVYIAQTGVMNRPTVSLIKNEPGFNIIKAVKNNQIFIINEMIVSRPTIRLLDGIYEIGKLLYPDVFSKIETMPSKRRDSKFCPPANNNLNQMVQYFEPTTKMILNENKN
ncbi:iron complex transport system substrate-binding protein [Candidatus Magnetomoraceae bacterium gMMP-13]